MTLGKILIFTPRNAARSWHVDLVRRLEAQGHTVAVRDVKSARSDGHVVEWAIAIERLLSGAAVAQPAMPFVSTNENMHDLVVDLTGVSGEQDKPLLRLEVFGSASFTKEVYDAVAARQGVEFVARLDGVAVGRARPAVSSGLRMSRALEEIFAGAISLVEQVVNRFFQGRLESFEELPVKKRPSRVFFLPYIGFAAATLFAKMTRKRAAYWQVAFRWVEGGSIAETGRLDGPAYSVLADDGERFYADPFVFRHGGRHYLFVEEFPYDLARGIISVSCLDDKGRFGLPRAVLEEPHHLSYPQVIAEGAEIYMLPESSAALEVVLYRAVRFPDRWQRHAVLIKGRALSDMTLLLWKGRYWLFGTEQYGAGNPSDTMVVYHAPALEGPWTPHGLNPVTIDCASARPGGAFFCINGQTYLPVQDCSQKYGGGLGFAQLLRLDDEAVVFGPVAPIAAGTAWARSSIHTLNRDGGLEVIDSRD